MVAPAVTMPVGLEEVILFILLVDHFLRHSGMFKTHVALGAPEG